MVHLLSYLVAFGVCLGLISLDVWPVWAIIASFASGMLTLTALALFCRRIVMKNTLAMIEAEALFHDQRAAEAIDFERRRARQAVFVDWAVPRMSIALPIYASLITKCMATRQLDEARYWVDKLERYAGRKSARLVDYFKLCLSSMAADLEALKKIGERMKKTLDPDKPDERGYLAQLAFMEAKWALRQSDIDEARRQTAEGHRLQPDLDIYYILRSQIALATGDLYEAQNYAKSLAEARLHNDPPGTTEALRQLMPLLERDVPRFGDELERLRGLLESDRGKFRSLGRFQEMEVAVASRDVALLESTVRALEEIGHDHPTVNIRLKCAAALIFAWSEQPISNDDRRLDAQRAVELARQGIAEARQPTCLDEDIATAGLWGALAMLDASDGLLDNSENPKDDRRALADEIRAALDFAMAPAQTRANRFIVHLGDFLALRLEIFSASPGAIPPATRERWRELAAAPEAEAFHGLWRDAAESLEMPTAAPTADADSKGSGDGDPALETHKLEADGSGSEGASNDE